MPSDTYAVLDFETTGLSPNRGDRAIEIGITLIRDAIEIDTFSSLINPGFHVDQFITDLTGISNHMLSWAPSAKDVMPRVLEFVGDAHLVAHNASFDSRFWCHELKVALGLDEQRGFLCTMMLSRRIFQSFSSHKLGEIAQKLSVDGHNNHRALADAQVTAQVLNIMLERLRVAYPDEIIDAQFLNSYLQKSKSRLPDLTEHHQCVQQAGIAVGTDKNARLAEIMNAEASSSLQMLEQLQAMTTTVDSRLDWGSLVSEQAFHTTIEPKPFIHYGDEGVPVDVEYVDIPTAKPEEPVLPARPVEGSFEPTLGMLDKLAFREMRLLRKGHDAYLDALQQWELDRQHQMTVFERESQRWFEAAESIDRENAKRYEQCIEDQKIWLQQKQQFEEEGNETVESIENFRKAYLRKDPPAVQRYISEVLSRSIYPDYFPDELTVSYDSSTRAVVVSMQLLQPAALPAVASVTYVETRDEIKSKPLSKTARNSLYGNVVKAVCVRTLHKIITSDTANAVQHVIVNGYVHTAGQSSGDETQLIIVSVATTRRKFLNLRLNKVDTASCFDGLGGRGAFHNLPKLQSVKAFTLNDFADVDGVDV